MISNLDKIHSTTMGIERVKKNLGLNTSDIIAWCIEKIKCADGIIRKGKNRYVQADDIVITINAHSYTVITAHKYQESACFNFANTLSVNLNKTPNQTPVQFGDRD